MIYKISAQLIYKIYYNLNRCLLKNKIHHHFQGISGTNARVKDFRNSIVAYKIIGITGHRNSKSFKYIIK